MGLQSTAYGLEAIQCWHGLEMEDLLNPCIADDHIKRCLREIGGACALRMDDSNCQLYIMIYIVSKNIRYIPDDKTDKRISSTKNSEYQLPRKLRMIISKMYHLLLYIHNF